MGHKEVLLLMTLNLSCEEWRNRGDKGYGLVQWTRVLGMVSISTQTPPLVQQPHGSHVWQFGPHSLPDWTVLDTEQVVVKRVDSCSFSFYAQFTLLPQHPSREAAQCPITIT